MNLMRLLNILALSGVMLTSGIFLARFQGLKGFGDVARMLRSKETTILLLALGPLLVNLNNVSDPLTTTTFEQIWTLGTRLFAVGTGIYGLLVWLRRKRIPLANLNRRSTDPK